MMSLLHNYLLAMARLEEYSTIFPPIPHLLQVRIFASIKWTTIYPSNCEMSGTFLILKKSRNNVQHKKLQIKICSIHGMSSKVHQLLQV